MYVDLDICTELMDLTESLLGSKYHFKLKMYVEDESTTGKENRIV
jgi:hypothetical protein